MLLDKGGVLESLGVFLSREKLKCEKGKNQTAKVEFFNTTNSKKRGMFLACQMGG